MRGRPKEYTEQTKMISFRCPKSIIPELRKYVYQYLKKYKHGSE